MRDFAAHLITYEAKLNKPRGMTSPASFPVLERLRPHLTTLMGNAGFRALLLRALALAGEEVQWLASAQVESNGHLSILDNQRALISSNQIQEGRVVLIAQMLGLMIAFIGEKLTLQMVRDVWPRLHFKDFNLSQEDKP